MERIIIGANEAGQRIDAFLMKHLCVPKGLIYRLIRTNKIKLNRKKPAIDARLCLQDTLELYLPPDFHTEKKAFVPIAYNLDIVYEDSHILILHKPTGLLSQPDDCHSEALSEYVKSYLYQKGDWNPSTELSFTPALCHRLDRNTEGLVIAAKTATALRIINEKIKNREIRKLYKAWVVDAPPSLSGEMKGYILKDKKNNKSKIVENPCDNAKHVHASWTTLTSEKGRTLLELELFSGRSHQLRTQLAHLGCPIVGDGKYGGDKKGVHAQQLVAYKIEFTFPTDAQELNYLRGKIFTI